MVTRTFLQSHADFIDTFREQLDEEGTCPPGLAFILARALDSVGEGPPGGDEAGEPQDEVDGEECRVWASWHGEPGEEADAPVVEYFHVTSRIHLGRYLLDKDHVKRLLGEQCLHYARVCKIELVHYCIMDNHFHLFIGVRSHSLSMSKMVGCIKQQFTNRFKAWFNGVYRKENRYRKQALTQGTLWQGRCRYERIEDDAQFGACSLYIENNRLVVTCKDAIAALEEGPRFSTDSPGGQGAPAACKDPRIGPLQPCYEGLLGRFSDFAFQSAGYYLGLCEGHATYLTSGMDAVRASDSEVRQYFREPAHELPEGWRKVWFKECPGILKTTPAMQRTYAKNPFYERLGQSPEVRAAQYGRLLMGACYRKRHAIAVIEDEERCGDVGVSYG